ncbi:MAG: EAL and HDOD domain-containing protein [Mariprofundaceae bacterium]
MHQILFSRQAILNRGYDVMGYELSCHGDGRVEATENDKRMMAFLLDMGIEKIAGKKQAFLEVDASFIEQSFSELLSPEHVGLIVPASVSQVCSVDCAEKLNELGYPLVIDLQDGEQADERWLDLAKYIRIHVGQMDLIKQLRVRTGSMIIAGVDDYESYHKLSDLGAGFFQGAFFSKPDLAMDQPVGPSRLSVLNAMQQIVRADSLEEIEAVLLQDMDLSYRMFKLINSAAFGFQREIDSVRQAVALLGKERIKLWLTTLSFASLNDNKPSELMHTALVRGRMMELLAEGDGHAHPSDIFLVGMFSLLDAMLDQPIENILETLTLPDAVRKGLIDSDDRYARMIGAIQTVEQQGWAAAVDGFQELGVEIKAVIPIYWDALEWADENALL